MGVAALEASLMHARNLHEFFGRQRRYSNDVRAEDFINDFHRDVFDREFLSEINHWVQHLTTWRYNDHKYPAWSVGTVVAPVAQAMDDFLKELDIGSALTAEAALISDYHAKALGLIRHYQLSRQ